MSTAALPERLAEAKAARSHTLFILGLAAIIRIVVVVYYCHVVPTPPMRLTGYENVNIALAIHSGQGFASPFLFPSGPTAFMTPIYPLLIAGFIYVFGVGPITSISLIAFQALLSLLTIAVLLRFARRDFGARAGNFAGLVFAMSVPMLRAPLYIWDTCLSALLLTIAVAIAPFIRTRLHFAIAGACCALAALLNPALLPTLVAVFAWSAWRARIIPWLSIVTFLFVYSPWPLRNYVRLHAIIPVRTNAGYELWLGNHPGSDGDSPSFSSPLNNEHEHQLFASLGEVAYMRQKTEVAQAWIIRHPREFARLTAIRFIRFWSGSSKAPVPLTIPLTIAAIIGLALLSRRKSLFVLFAIPLIIYPLPYYITHADSRYQFVIDPLLAILAGYALDFLLALISGQKLPSSEASQQPAVHHASA